MKKRMLILLFIFSGSLFVFSQRPHLEIGGTLGFKDEFFYRPSFHPNAKSTEFHIYDASLFTRVSKLKWGGELGIGFEKAGYYITQNFNNSSALEFMNLNRLSLDIGSFYYLIKKPHFKWDVQLGIRNYLNLSRTTFIPEKQALNVWKLGTRFTSNLTFKSLFIGLFYEYEIHSDYSFNKIPNIFGLRVGRIF
jgi:hypothetical protein